MEAGQGMSHVIKSRNFSRPQSSILTTQSPNVTTSSQPTTLDMDESRTEIVLDGDCILVVGPDKMKLRVHSQFLGAVSKPFSAMFAPAWKEGDALLSQSNPTEILLPEDNASSMRLVCAIIHHKTRDIPDKLSARDFLGVALIADKYDCVQSLRFASESWFHGHNDEAGDLVVLAAAAYLLWNGTAFKEITKTMILTLSGPYHNLSSPEVESVMDWRVFCKCSRNNSVFCWLRNVKAC
jgi:hypothetical protein